MVTRAPFLDRCPVCGAAGTSPVVEFPELGAATLWEVARYLLLVSWVWVCRVTHFRREIQIIAGKQEALPSTTALPARSVA